jgi:hypothetical protein
VLTAAKWAFCFRECLMHGHDMTIYWKLAVVLTQPQSNTSDCSLETNQDSLQSGIYPGQHVENIWKLKNLCAVITTARISVYKWTEPTFGFYATSLNEELVTVHWAKIKKESV